MPDPSDTQVAIIGFGKFGRALGSLVAAAGAGLRAWDPHVQIPAQIRARNARECLDGATHVCLAVPVTKIRSALEALSMYTPLDALVFDVGSVKVSPQQAMENVLGPRIAWVGTHPLFGPTSLALAERPLRVVVCPNKLHPDAASRARAFYESIGCVVTEQDASDHDRVMARTHALTFFIAKGMIDAGALVSTEFTPASYKGIARAIEAVQSDANHLFRVIELENPFAADAREGLLDALGKVNQALSEVEIVERDSIIPDWEDSEELTVPDLGARSPALREARDLIDAVDRELVALLARRAELAARAGLAKEELGRGVLDTAREAAVRGNRQRWARDVGLDPDAVDEIFQAIIRFSRQVQRRRV